MQAIGDDPTLSTPIRLAPEDIEKIMFPVLVFNPWHEKKRGWGFHTFVNGISYCKIDNEPGVKYVIIDLCEGVVEIIKEWYAIEIPNDRAHIVSFLRSYLPIWLNWEIQERMQDIRPEDWRQEWNNYIIENSNH